MLYLVLNVSGDHDEQNIVLEKTVIDKPTKESLIENTNPQGLPNRSEYVKEANKYAEWQKQQHEIRKNIVVTPKMKEAIKERMMPLVELSERMLKKIKFFGRVVDQNGNGIQNLSIRSSGTNSTFAQGSSDGYTTTDSEGYFSIFDAKGKSLYLYQSSRVGYEFPEGKYLNIQKWAAHDANNPYIVNAWKVEKYPRLKTKSTSFGFVPDGRTYTIDLTKKKEHKIEGETEGDLLIRATRDEFNFVFEIRAISGGLQETDDIYLYMAPETGYKHKIVLSGPRKRSIERKLYFSTRNGEVYGSADIKVRGRFKEHVGMTIDYSINLEQGRNLTVKK